MQSSYTSVFTSAPAYLTVELCQVANVEARQRLRSSSSSPLIAAAPDCLSSVSELFLFFYGVRSNFNKLKTPDHEWGLACLVGCCCSEPARIWNSLPDLVTFAPSVAVFWSRLKTHLFNFSTPFPLWLYSARAVTLSSFGHYNRSSLLTYTLPLFPSASRSWPLNSPNKIPGSYVRRAGISVVKNK